MASYLRRAPPPAIIDREQGADGARSRPPAGAGT
jgi:hypothetical protein